MPNLSIRKLDKAAYEKLRLRAARGSGSMEEEARQIIYQAVSAPETIVGVFQKYFGVKNGIDLMETPDIHLPHEPIDFSK